MSVSGIHGQLLEVTVVECNKLKDTEWISKQDPYVCLEYGTTKFRTRTCTDGGKNPIFQEKFVFTLIEGLREISVVVWNSNKLTYDDFIGSGRVLFEDVLRGGYDDRSWSLQTKTGRYAGEVKLIMHYAKATPFGSRSTGSVTPSAPPYSPQPQVPMYSTPLPSPTPAYPPTPSTAYPPPPTTAYPPYPYSHNTNPATSHYSYHHSDTNHTTSHYPYPRSDTNHTTSPYPNPHNDTNNTTSHYPYPHSDTNHTTSPYPNPHNDTIHTTSPCTHTNLTTSPYPYPHSTNPTASHYRNPNPGTYPPNPYPPNPYPPPHDHSAYPSPSSPYPPPHSVYPPPPHVSPYPPSGHYPGCGAYPPPPY